jgi:hypothetical protein
MTEAQVRQIVALALIPYEKRLSALEHTATLPVPAPAPTPAPTPTPPAVPNVPPIADGFPSPGASTPPSFDSPFASAAILVGRAD